MTPADWAAADAMVKKIPDPEMRDVFLRFGIRQGCAVMREHNIVPTLASIWRHRAASSTRWSGRTSRSSPG
jgi:hypothetical protein